MPIDLTRRRLAAAGLLLGGGLPRVARAAADRRPLVVWYTPDGAQAIRRIGAAFTAATGVPVVVETPDGIPARFQQAAAGGKGPDVCTFPHDRIGEYVAGGLLHAVSPSREVLADLDPQAWQAMQWRGRAWGYPLAVDAVTLIHNRALVPRAPASFDEVFEIEARLARQGRHALLWDYTNAYFTWPLMAAGGAYAFRRREDGSYDVRDTGVAHEGARRGAALLQRLLREGVMTPGSGYAEMEAAMAQGRAAMMINGAWSWVNLQRAGIDFGVARIPAVDGRASAPFLGVRALLVNRATAQRELAVEFIERWLLAPEGLRALDAAEPLGLPASRAFYAELAARPGVGERVAGIRDSARAGVVIPPVPEMGRFWSATKAALTHLTEGRQSAPEALQAAERRIREAS